MQQAMEWQLAAVPLSRVVGGDNLLQSGFWGAFKARFGWTPRAYRLSAFGASEGGAALLTLTRELSPGVTLSYVPQGPDLALASEDQGPFLEELSRRLGHRLPGKTAFIRYDLPWRSPYARQRPNADLPPGRAALPEIPGPRLRELRMNFGTREWRLRKAPTDLQPPDTVVLDLEGREESILARMRPNTRHNIRLARSSGVGVREASPRELPAWYALYRDTAQRQGIRAQQLPYFQGLFLTAQQFGPGSPELHLLLARAEGRLAAGMILAVYGRKALYLFGASSWAQRRLMPGYALQWRAIQLARARGCTLYDLYGIPPTRQASHPLHGLYLFKTGFGGRIVHRRGCWDYAFRPALYERYRGVELAVPPYHLR
jgi:lipid II:glycine glycyltransferase (peptidoglycan interpeptide bridge formation enzyme)